jgi:hypothetical protein
LAPHPYHYCRNSDNRSGRAARSPWSRARPRGWNLRAFDALETPRRWWFYAKSAISAGLTRRLCRGTLREMGAIRLRRMETVLGFVGALFAASCSSGPISVGDHRVLLVSDSGSDAELDSGGGVDASFESAVADASFESAVADGTKRRCVVTTLRRRHGGVRTRSDRSLQSRPGRPASVICQLSRPFGVRSSWCSVRARARRSATRLRICFQAVDGARLAGRIPRCRRPSVRRSVGALDELRLDGRGPQDGQRRGRRLQRPSRVRNPRHGRRSGHHRRRVVCDGLFARDESEPDGGRGNERGHLRCVSRHQRD